MIDSFSEAEKLLLVFDMFPKFTDLIGFTILSSHLGGQYIIGVETIKNIELINAMNVVVIKKFY